MARLLLAFAAAALLQAGAVAAQPPADPAPILRAAGLDLPERLCSLTRRQLVAGSDSVRATYEVAGGSVDIFIVPIARPLAEEFAETEQIIGRLHTDLTALRDLAGPPGVPGVIGRLWRGALASRPVVTGMLLWHHGGLRIKLRGTVAAALADSAWPEIECAVRALARARTTA
ncbi:MAG TPA: hypothetical protein VMS43_08795 [Allosphingosinicella sp.]|nr:hypothetical protein [Allosphingosinicella sp.]